MATAAALLFAAVTAAVIAFQVALALGAPWGGYAMGGRFPRQFPPRMRVAAIAQAVVLSLAVVVVLSDASIVVPSLAATFPGLIWLVVALSAVSLVLNTLTPSVRERRIWAPVAVVMLVCGLVVAVSP